MNVKRSKLTFLLFLPSIQMISVILFLGNDVDLNKQEKITPNLKEVDVYPSLSYPNNAFHFRYYKTITINHEKVNGTGSHSNFPLLISILDEQVIVLFAFYRL